jgi:DNA-binding NarL/FixJ family response regulator
MHLEQTEHGSPRAAEDSQTGAATPPTAIAIVGGSRLYRDGLAQMLAGRRDVTVVGTAPDADRGVELVRSTRADVVLADVAQPESLPELRRLTSMGPPVVALTVPETTGAVIACAEAGIVGFVTREGALEDLVGAVKSASRGETACSPRTATILLGHIQALGRHRRPPEPEPQTDAAGRLTRREREIAVLIDQGLSNKEIATRLFIEVPTVKNHVHNILEKLRVRRRLDVGRSLRRIEDPVPRD